MPVSKKKKVSFFRKKITRGLLIFLLGLLVLRLFLPAIVKTYVNKAIADIPGYYGHVDDIDIALIRGAYVIEELVLNKIDADAEVPFIRIEKADISIDWSAIFKGKIVSEIALTNPTIIYVFEDQGAGASSTKPALADWSNALTDLVPIAINNLRMTGGKAAFVEINAEPTIDIHLDDIELEATNLRNVRQKEKVLPSELNLRARSVGQGDVRLTGKLNLIKQIPDVDLNFALENADLTAVNDLSSHYAGIDFKSGTFNLFSEIVIADGFLKGSLKPIITAAILHSKEDGFLESLWEGFVGFFKFILKNQKKNTLATKVPLAGDLNQVGTEIWTTLFNIFKNGWIQAYKNTIDDSIDFEEVVKATEKE